MEAAEKLIRVTPQKLQAILDRLEAEHTTRLAILGPSVSLSADPNDWPEPVRGQQVFQLGEPWPGLVNRVIRLRHLDRLALLGLDLGDAGARAIAEHLTQLRTLELDNSQAAHATIGVLGQRLRNLTGLWIAGNKDVHDIEPLAGLPTLRRLNVSKTSVSDLGPFADRIANGWPSVATT